MKFLSRLFEASKKTKLGIATATTLVVLATTMGVYAGFGPERQVFDWNNNPAVCDLQANRGDRCGSIQPTFNSFVNTPSYGDERNFTRIAPVTAGQSPTDANFSEGQEATAGKEYWVRTLVHNDANQNLNCAPAHRDPATNNCTQIDPGSPGIATNTRVKLEIPQGVGNKVEVMTKVSASNAAPGTVWDTADLTSSSQVFSVAYQPGSAVLYNDIHKGGVPINDSITSAEGALVGYGPMDGNVPGCFDYAAYVYIKVKVTAPAIKLEKLVRMAGEGSDKWRPELAAKKGERVQYLLDYKNTGTGLASKVAVRDQLPSNMALVPGSVKRIDTNFPAPGQAVPDDLLFTPGGILLGDYLVNGGGYVIFDATVKTEQAECTATNVAFVRGEDIPESSSDAVVTVTDCQPVETEEPVYRCDLLTVRPVGERKYSYKVDYTATNGATLKSYTYNFGDGTQPLTTDRNPVEYTYAEEGTFASKVTVNFRVEGQQDQSATSVACEKPITVAKENCPVKGKENLPKNSPECVETITKVTTTPTVLPDTGAGAIASIFGSVSVLGALVHRYVLSRRYND